MTKDTRISLLVPAQELEDDDRYGWLASHLQSKASDGIEREWIGHIAEDTFRSVDEVIETATILYNDGYLENTD